VPSKQDIENLSKRVVDLSAAVEALTEGKGSIQASATTEVDAGADTAAVAKPAPRPRTRKPAAPRAVTPADVLGTLPQSQD